MQILETSSIKKEFNDDEKNPLEMRLINKTKIIKNVSKNIVDIKTTSFIKTKCRGSYICETKYN